MSRDVPIHVMRTPRDSDNLSDKAWDVTDSYYEFRIEVAKSIRSLTPLSGTPKWKTDDQASINCARETAQ